MNKHILLKTIKDKKGKYGRYLGKIYIEVDKEVDKEVGNKYICINDWLLENNYAVVYE